jgi:hypothetical protein
MYLLHPLFQSPKSLTHLSRQSQYSQALICITSLPISWMGQCTRAEYIQLTAPNTGPCFSLHMVQQAHKA